MRAASAGSTLGSATPAGVVAISCGCSLGIETGPAASAAGVSAVGASVAGARRALSLRADGSAASLGVAIRLGRLAGARGHLLRRRRQHERA